MRCAVLCLGRAIVTEQRHMATVLAVGELVTLSMSKKVRPSSVRSVHGFKKLGNSGCRQARKQREMKRVQKVSGKKEICFSLLLR